jgi:hypothetical protein
VSERGLLLEESRTRPDWMVVWEWQRLVFIWYWDSLKSWRNLLRRVICDVFVMLDEIKIRDFGMI